MKLSKVLHVVSVLVGFVGVITFIATLLGGSDNAVFGVTKMDALACTAILILLAIWSQQGAIHHMMLEKQGEII